MPTSRSRSWLLTGALFAVGCAHPSAAGRRSKPQAGPEVDPVELVLARAPSGAFLVRCNPSDAEVEVDGVVRGLAKDFDGTTGFLRLSPGAHHLELRRRGYARVGFDVVATDGRQTLDLQLPPTTAGGG